MKVSVHRIDTTLPLPKFHTKGSFAFDFVARETIEVAAGEVQFVPGNVIVGCPDNLALLIMPRSSLFRKKSLILPNSPGLIDQDYCGPEDEIKIQVLNLGKEKVVVERGERIAQGLFVRTETIEFQEIDRPEGDSRGGFGSTGM